MPTFESLIYDASLERITDKYRVGAVLQAAAALGPTSLQLGHVGEYPLQKHTPGGVAVTDANIAAAIRAAYAAAESDGGGTVVIPPGAWSLGDEEFVFATAGSARVNTKIRGSGMDGTVLNMASPYTGTVFKLSGEASPGNFYVNGGIAHLSINCDAADAGNTGCAIHLESTVNTQLAYVTIRNFVGVGGAGLRTRRVGVDGTNQYTQLYNVTCSGNDVNYDLQSLINAQGYGVYSASGATRDWLCDDVKLSVYGGNFQTSAPIAFELAGDGNSRIALMHFYYEGFAGTIFKLNAPAVSSNALNIEGFILSGAPAIFADTDQFNSLTLVDIHGAANATKILKARNGAQVFMVNSGDPVSLPGKFDLDAASAATLVCHGLGGSQYVGSRIVAARGFGLPAFAAGSEPSSPVAGDLIRDTTYDRPSVYTGGATWRRLAYTADEQDLTALLTPYCSEIFDPAVARLRSVVSGGLDTITGLLAGTVLSAPGSGQRPVWNAADDKLAGRPSFSCAFSGDHYVSGSLSATIPIGSRPGLLVVFRASVAGTDTNRRYAALLESTGHTTAMLVAYGDAINDALHPYAYYVPWGGGTSALSGPASLDVYGHVALLTSDPVDSLYLDQLAAITGADHGNTTAVASLVHLGAAWSGAAYLGCDVAIAYCAVLKQALPSELRDRVNKLAQTKYGLR